MQITVWCDCDQELVFYNYVDLEMEGGTVGGGAAFLIEASQVFPDGGLGVVALAPGTVGKHVIGHVFDDGVEYHAVAVWRN